MNGLLTKIRQFDILSTADIMGMRLGMLAGKFLLSLFIVRYIGLEALGIYGLISGAAAIIQMAVRLGVFSSLSRIAVNQPLEQLTQNLRHYGVGCLVLYLLLLPIVIAAGWHFDQMEIALLSFAAIVLEHISLDVFVLTNNLNKPRLANMLLSLQSAFWIYLFMAIAFIIPSLRTLDAVFTFWIGGGIATAVVAAFLTRHWPWKQAFNGKVSLSWYHFHVIGSWRIYVSELIGVLSLYIDRYLISIFLNLELAGVYILFWQVTNAICNLVGASVLQVYRPRLISAYQEKNDGEFKSLFYESAGRAMGMTVLLSIAASIVIPFLIGLTDHPMAMEYLPLFWLMLFALLFRTAADICSYTLFAQHRDDLVLWSGGFKLLLSAGIGAATLFWIGIYGIVATSIIAGISVVLYTAYAWKKERATS